MPLVNNKVGDGCTAGRDKAVADGKALVDSLVKVSLFLFFCFFTSLIIGAKQVLRNQNFKLGFWGHFSRISQLGNF